MNTQNPTIGIIGSAGAYGRWLRAFFEQRMGLRVLGQDPADTHSEPPEVLVLHADVLLFSTPIRHTIAIINQYVELAAGHGGGRDSEQLWLDVTSIKAEPMRAMLVSRAEVVGLHPMTAPPKSPTLRGRAMAVCEARLSRWKPWFAQLLQALEAECVRVTPEHHDRAMALVQAMVHASHLAQASVLQESFSDVGGLAGLLPLRSASFEMDVAMATRILSLNPAIYEDIQFGNPHVPDVLHGLANQLTKLAALVRQGDEDARNSFRKTFLTSNQQAFGTNALDAGNYTYERLAYLLADLADPHAMRVYLAEDKPGSLRELLHIFETHGVNIASLHSSRTPSGELHFRFGFNRDTAPEQLEAVAQVLQETSTCTVLQG